MINSNNKLWIKLYPWLMWLVAAGFFFYKYLIQVSPSVMTHELMQTFHVNGAGLGNLSAFYFYAYLIMQIPVGLLLDKYSLKLLATFAIFLCSLSTLLFAQTDSLALACVSRAMMGIGASFAAVSCFKLTSQWFAPKYFALISGMFMTAAMLGAVGGQMPLSLLVHDIGWRAALNVIGFIGIGLGCLYFVIIKDQQQLQPMKNNFIKEQSKFSQLPLIRILFNKQTWWLSLYSGLAFAPVSVFGGLWGVPFLQTAYNLSSSDAALAVSCIFIGFAFGAPMLGWLSDVIGRRKPILFTGTFVAIICLTIVIYSNTHSLYVLIVLLFIFGFGASGFFTSFAMIREVFPLWLAATVLGFMNTFNSICEALYEPLVGIVLDMTSLKTKANVIHQFSIENYHAALLILPLSLFLAIIFLFFIKETYCKPNS